MVEVWPVVRVVGIGEFDTSVDFLHSYYLDYYPTVNADEYRENFFGYPDFSKTATLSIYAHPQDSITFKAPGFSPARLDNSLMYVSSGGSVRNTYFINAWKISHTPVFPSGSGPFIMVWRTPKTNFFLARGIETSRAHPFFGVQSITEFYTTSTSPVELKRWDFENVKYRDIFMYVSLWNTLNYYSYIRFDISRDGASWTVITGNIAVSGTTEKFAYVIASNIEFRYLRMVCWVSGAAGYYRVRKLYVFE